MSLPSLITIYRFESPCGRYCYVGQTNNLNKRIWEHRVSSESAIYTHCIECHSCIHQRQSTGGWMHCFTEIGSATSSKHVRELESRYINEACQQFLLDSGSRFPLNGKTEVGSGIWLRAAKCVRNERWAHEESLAEIALLKRQLLTEQAKRQNAEITERRIREELGQERRARGMTQGQAAVRAERPGQQHQNRADERNRKGYSLRARIRSLFRSGES